MKSYTDIEESKQLAEILPIETADMVYINGKAQLGFVCEAYEELGDNVLQDYEPCWSLAALLDALPRIEHLRPSIDLNPTLDSNEVAIYYHSEDSPYIVRDNLIDAVFEMICWLKESNKLFL